MIEIRETEIYALWFSSLRDRQAKARIDTRIRRLSLGNPGDVKPGCLRTPHQLWARLSDLFYSDRIHINCLAHRR
jgi:hypothetical protein